jgi:hypothetical protein
MPKLEYRQQKIQAKRKQTSRKDFIKEVCSRRPLAFYKLNIGVSKYPNQSSRMLPLVTPKKYIQDNPDGTTYCQDIALDKPFLEQFQQFFYSAPHALLNTYGMSVDNSDWCDSSWNGVKNAYLCVSVGDNAENILYSFKTETNVRNIISGINITS